MGLEATFVCSAFDLTGCPRWERMEVAFCGRSNVGKSSLLNALVGMKNLARTSKTPGRTRSLNFFALGEELGLVDLPGYGYARMPKEQARRLSSLLTSYIERRRNLAALVMLVDARRGPEQEELDLAQSARRRAIELIVAATKCDKLRRSERARAVAAFEPLGAKPILCSARDGEGIEELRREVLSLGRRAGAGRAI